MKTDYSLYVKLNRMLEIRSSKLCSELTAFADKCIYEKSNFMTKQERSQNVLKHSSRFYRNIFEVEGVLSKMSKGQLPQAFKQKEIECLTQEEFENKSEEERKHLIKEMWKENAIINARLANIYNRNAHIAEEQNQINYRKLLFSKKDVAMQEFLICAIRYNKRCAELGLENDCIAFGFSRDSKNGSMVLQSSLPEFTRLSVHFGTWSNFKTIIENVNKSCELDEDKKITPQNAQTKYRYALPITETNLGIINKDDFNESQLLANQFRQKARAEDGSIDKRGMQEFVYFMNSNMKLNDRELFHLAELGGLGKGFLENLSSILQERESMQVEANKKGISIADYYVQQQISQVKSKEELSTLASRLWNCRKLELDNDFEQEDLEEFKEYFRDMLNEIQKDKGNKKTDAYSQIFEMVVSEDINLEDCRTADTIEGNLENEQETPI